MALKKSIDKATFDNLPSDFQKEYKAVGDKFVLDIEGDDGVDWKHKRDIEAEHRKRAEDKVTKTQEELDNLRRGAIPKDDVEALENSYKTKATESQEKHARELKERDAVIERVTVDAAAKDISAIFLAPGAMIPMVRSRLKVEITDGVAVTRVLDKNGQPSALSIADLKTEFKNDASLKPVIIASKASGGGSGGGKDDGGAGGHHGGKKLKDMGDAERIEFFKTDPDGFRRAVAEQSKP